MTDPPATPTPVPPAGWLTPLPDADQQRAIDRWAIDSRRIPSDRLMERAGRGLAELTGVRVPSGRIVVIVGKGNNGGDGLVAARHLREAGRDVDVRLLVDPGDLSGDPAVNLARLPGPPPRPFSPDALDGASAIVDAILGTGFEGEPRDPAASAIAAINAHHGATVIACDVPSGVDASTGEIAADAVRADVTVTFHAAKPGLWIAPGKTRAGAVRVVDIGIPRHGAPAEAAAGLIEGTVLDGVPRRGGDSTKFAAGAVLVCGGSTGLTGAPCMACEAAMRAGAGYVTALVPASLNLAFEQRLLEAMSVPLPDRDGALTADGVDIVLERAERAGALVLGPGLGRSDETFALSRELARRAEIPLLLDADGLNAHAGHLDELAGRSAPTVITPHAGELARLLESDSDAVGARRLACAREAARRSGAIIVLKGDDSIIAAPDGRVAINRGGAPALATAGTGDVLSGVIGAYLSKRMEPWHAAAAGVYLHARAGRLAAQEIGTEGVVAHDVIDRLPAARAAGR